MKAAAKAKEAELGLGIEQPQAVPAGDVNPDAAHVTPEAADRGIAGEVEQSDSPGRSSTGADFITIGLGTAMGALIGIPVITVGTLPLALTPSVGALLLGLIVGWHRAKTSTVDRNPTGVLWFFETAGLTVFVAMIGINAGPGFIDGMRDFGVELLLAGVVVTLTPLVIGTLVARYVFKFDAVLTLGMLAGARTSSAAAGAVQEAAGSNVPLLAYTVPYAVSRTGLSIGGAIVVAFVA